MSDNLLNQFDEDASNSIPTEEALNRISVLINRHIELEQEIADLNEIIASKQVLLNKISMEEIPDMFNALGLQELKLSNGGKIKIIKVYSGSISEENKFAALSWLREHNFGDLIKHEIKAQLGKGEDEKAEQLCEQLLELGINYTDTESVHAITLKAFIKEQVENMAELPSDDLPEGQDDKFPMKLFNVY